MIARLNYFFLLLLCCAFVLTSCDEEYFIDSDDFESKLVVNSLIDASEPWKVTVSNSYNILDQNATSNPVVNAMVEVFDKDGKLLYELYHTENGVYSREEYYPSTTKKYSIKVSAPGFKTVTASSYVPEKSELRINDFSLIDKEDGEGVEVDFAIVDKSKVEAFYVWEIVKVVEDTGGDSGQNTELSSTWLDDLTSNSENLLKTSRRVIGAGQFGDGTYETIYNSFDANRLTIKEDLMAYESNNLPTETVFLAGKLNPYGGPDFDVDGGTFSGSEDVSTSLPKGGVNYELRVMAISKELYDYYLSVQEYLRYNAGNNSIQNPYDIYSNIKNGHGIFAGYTESVIQF